MDADLPPPPTHVPPPPAVKAPQPPVRASPCLQYMYNMFIHSYVYISALRREICIAHISVWITISTSPM